MITTQWAGEESWVIQSIFPCKVFLWNLLSTNNIFSYLYCSCCLYLYVALFSWTVFFCSLFIHKRKLLSLLVYKGKYKPQMFREQQPFIYMLCVLTHLVLSFLTHSLHLMVKMRMSCSSPLWSTMCPTPSRCPKKLSLSAKGWVNLTMKHDLPFISFCGFSRKSEICQLS